MIPTLVPNPFHRDGWVYEEQADGYLMLAYKGGPRVCLLSGGSHRGMQTPISSTLRAAWRRMA
jgi:hypothetical protein